MKAAPWFSKHFEYLKTKFGSYASALAEIFRMREGESPDEAKALPPGFFDEFDRLGTKFSKVRLREGLKEAMAKEPERTLAAIKEVKEEYGVESDDSCVYFGRPSVFLLFLVRNGVYFDVRHRE